MITKETMTILGILQKSNRGKVRSMELTYAYEEEPARQFWLIGVSNLQIRRLNTSCTKSSKQGLDEAKKELEVLSRTRSQLSHASDYGSFMRSHKKISRIASLYKYHPTDISNIEQNSFEISHHAKQDSPSQLKLPNIKLKTADQSKLVLSRTKQRHKITNNKSYTQEIKNKLSGYIKMYRQVLMNENNNSGESPISDKEEYGFLNNDLSFRDIRRNANKKDLLKIVFVRNDKGKNQEFEDRYYNNPSRIRQNYSFNIPK